MKNLSGMPIMQKTKSSIDIKNPIPLLIVFFLFHVLWGCKSKQITIDSKETTTSLSLSKIIANHTKSKLDFQFLQGKIKFNFTQKEKSFGQTLSWRMHKDQVIWISAPLALVRAKVTPKKVQYYNKLNNTYFDGDFSILTKLIGVSAQFNDLQNLLLGQLPETIEKLKPRLDGFSPQGYRVTAKKENNPFIYSFLIDGNHFKLKETFFNEIENSRLVKTKYINYQKVEGRQLPQNISIEVIDKNIREKSITLEYNNIKWTQNPLRFPFKIPTGYKKIVVN